MSKNVEDCVGIRSDFLKEDFVKLIERTKDRDEKLTFYFLLLLKSADYDGKLMRTESIPYTEKTLSLDTGINLKIVKSTLDLLKRSRLITILNNGTICTNKQQTKCVRI